MQVITEPIINTVTHGIIEGEYEGMVVLSPSQSRFRRRMVYLDSYGGRSMWEKIKQGEMPSHHLRGCLELARMGYEIVLAEPIRDFVPRRPLPHDLRLFKLARSWLGHNGIVFCGHNVLYWLPFLRMIGAIRCHIVSHLWAREPLDWARAHSGILALTPAAEEHARKLVPGAKVGYFGWGADLTAFPRLPYNPQWFLHCGIAGRDFATLSAAASQISHPVRVIASWVPQGLTWSPNVQIIESGPGFNFQDKKVSFRDLLYTHYAGSTGSLITTVADPDQHHALGFTNLVEALAMAQPIILTRTGTLPAEVDVEKEGCGLFVPPNDAGAMAEAMSAIASNPIRAEAMSRSARRLCETRYDIRRYARDLDQFFENL
jgi:hypothetical protein